MYIGVHDPFNVKKFVLVTGVEPRGEYWHLSDPLHLVSCGRLLAIHYKRVSVHPSFYGSAHFFCIAEVACRKSYSH